VVIERMRKGDQRNVGVNSIESWKERPGGGNVGTVKIKAIVLRRVAESLLSRVRLIVRRELKPSSIT
jgi:hypothetical protein